MLNATERSGLSQGRVGDELTVWIDEDNNVVDVHQKGHHLEHRLITGKLAYSDNSKTEMKLLTPESNWLTVTARAMTELLETYIRKNHSGTKPVLRPRLIGLTTSLNCYKHTDSDAPLCLCISCMFRG